MKLRRTKIVPILGHPVCAHKRLVTFRIGNVSENHKIVIYPAQVVYENTPIQFCYE